MRASGVFWGCGVVLTLAADLAHAASRALTTQGQTPQGQSSQGQSSQGQTPQGQTPQGQTSQGNPTPHNVLLIVLDDCGVDLIGAYEQHFRARGRTPGFPAETPAIDALLCAQGMSFSNAWTSPMCSPSRAQILTGMQGSRTGVGAILRRNPLGSLPNPGLAQGHVLLPQALSAGSAAYASGAVGKWHLADIDQLALDLAHPLGTPNGSWFDAYAGSLFNLEKAFSAPAGTNFYFAWRKTHASPIQIGASPCGTAGYPCEVDVVAPPVTRYATADTTADALALMGQLPEPWFLYVAYNGPHTPGHVAPLSLPAPPCLPASAMSAACEYDRAGGLSAQARCMLRAIDSQIGRLLCAHDPQDTTVILIGDNGTDGDATLPPFDNTHAKGQVYQGGVQVPLVVRSPLIPAQLRGSFDERLVSGADLFATIAALAGAPSSAPDSVSVVPYLTGQASTPLRTYVYTEGFFPNFTPQSPGSGRPPGFVAGVHNQAVRDARFKLIRRWNRIGSGGGTLTLEELLFDLTEGGPPDTSVFPPLPTPDWFEQNELLSSGAPLSPQAQAAYAQLGAWLDANFPTLAL